MKIELDIHVHADTAEPDGFNLKRIEDGLALITAELAREAYLHADLEVHKMVTE